MEQIISVTDLKNKRVFDASGNDCGHLTSILIDPHDAKPLFALVKMEDFDMGGSTAVPWNAINILPETGKVMLRMNKDLLNHSPKFKESDFKSKNSEAYHEVVKFYGNQSDERSKSSLLTQDALYDYHQSHEGEEYSSNPADDIERNKMGEELNYNKIKGIEDEH